MIPNLDDGGVKFRRASFFFMDSKKIPFSNPRRLLVPRFTNFVVSFLASYRCSAMDIYIHSM